MIGSPPSGSAWNAAQAALVALVTRAGGKVRLSVDELEDAMFARIGTAPDTAGDGLVITVRGAKPKKRKPEPLRDPRPPRPPALDMTED